MACFRFRQIFVFFAFVWVAHAHTAIFNFKADNQKFEMYKYIRPHYQNYNYPVKDVNSQDLVCRTSDMSSANTDTRDVTAGSTVGVFFKADGSPEHVIFDRSHKGPCLVYMAPMASNGKGDVWFKIFEQGYDMATKQWCSEHVIDANGELDITLPADIADGEYLLRPEIIALHTAYDIGGAEFYANCVQIRVSGGGSSKPAGVPIPGVYNADDPGIHFNIYEEIKGYPIPGPKVYVAGSSTDNGSSSDSSDSSDTTDGTDGETIEDPSSADNEKNYNPSSTYSDSEPVDEPTSHHVPQPRCNAARKR
ncbi:hypothetical protein H4R20_001120 [Coemansia guatemalensis]|uniref:AA9 family lytic polysaccharide monooxygenase n=1 Tax=Coemansia guatemalensis TaxID=2761395 RepID=A0A9W8LV80_9FUNG|nr:hypothetical protein H4R20_001120 [Coemansia guatemalensis]